MLSKLMQQEESSMCTVLLYHEEWVGLLKRVEAL